MSTRDDVAAVVAVAAGRTVVEIRDLLRADGRVSITSADVVRVLDRHRHRFLVDGGTARWWPTDPDPTTPGPATPGSATPAGPVRPARRPDAAAVLDLYRWQHEALDAWRQRNERGVIEAVTGTGKTIVGVAAVSGELARGGQALVVVPTCELADQWTGVLARHGPPTARVGRLGGGHRDGLGDHDIVVAVVNSARDNDLRPRRPGGLIIADECHRYGCDANQVALHTGFPHRLGLSATYARSDDGHRTWLDPYFGGTCYRLGYRRAIDDAIIAPFTVTLHPVELAVDERVDYQELTATITAARAQVLAAGHIPTEPVAAFFAAVARLARLGDSEASLVARRYLAAVQQRRRLLADTAAKTAALDALAPALRACERGIVFTQSIAAAEHAADRLRRHGLTAAAIHSQLDPDRRRAVLTGFAGGDLHVLTAPRVLDEGVDVPAADLAVVLAASRSRRQMIQRMGRVLRRKTDGRTARFVIVYATATVEDPALGAHEGFLDEITDAAMTVTRYHTLGSVASVEDRTIDAAEHHGTVQHPGRSPRAAGPDTTRRRTMSDIAEHAEQASEHVRQLARALAVGPDPTVDIADLDALVDVASLYATIGSLSMLLYRLAAVTGPLHQHVAGLDGHVESDDATLNITVVLAGACAGLEAAGALLHDAARHLDDSHQATARIRPTIHT